MIVFSRLGLLPLLSSLRHSRQISSSYPVISLCSPQQRHRYGIICQAGKVAGNLNNPKKNASNHQQKRYKKKRKRIQSIEECRSVFELVQYVRQSSDLFTLDNGGKMVFEKTKLLAPKMKPKDLALLLSGLSKQRVRSGQNFHRNTMSLLVDMTMSQIRKFNAQNISLVVNALAKKRVQNRLFFDAAANRAIVIIDTFNAQDLAITVNAFANMKHDNPELFDKIAIAAIPIIDTFNAQNLAITVNAFAKMDNDSPELFNEVASAVIPIIDTFNAQDLANIVNAFAKMNYNNIELFDNAAIAAIPIINTFTNQGLSNTVNAFAKMDHAHPALFNNVAIATIAIIDTFNAQGLAITVNAFAKVNHSHPKLFNAVAIAAIPIIDTFNAQELANTLSAFARGRMSGQQSDLLYLNIAQVMMNNKDISKWPGRTLVELGYAFLKGEYDDKELLDTIGHAIINKDEVKLSARQLGNLAACFSCTEVSCSAKVLNHISCNFQCMQRDMFDLQNVADVAGSMWMAQRLNVASPAMLTSVVNLAISKSNECRQEDVRDILLGLDPVDLPDNLWLDLLSTYKPFFKLYSTDLSEANRSKILKIYERSSIPIDIAGIC